MSAACDPRGVGAQIRMKLPFLAPPEARVAAAITARADLGPDGPLRAVARDAGLSDAMVVKVAKKPGLGGFRAALAVCRQTGGAAFPAEIPPDESAAGLVQKMLRAAIQALETLAILDTAAFDRAADLLHRARTMAAVDQRRGREERR